MSGSLTILAAYVFLALTFGAAAFQAALACGAPWGEFAMGGRFPGKFPPAIRALAVAQMALLLGLGALIASRSGIAFESFADASRPATWVVVGFSALSLIANLATPSRRERMIWAPVALLMTASSVIVALGD